MWWVRWRFRVWIVRLRRWLWFIVDWNLSLDCVTLVSSWKLRGEWPPKAWHSGSWHGPSWNSSPSLRRARCQFNVTSMEKPFRGVCIWYRLFLGALSSGAASVNRERNVGAWNGVTGLETWSQYAHVTWRRHDTILCLWALTGSRIGVWVSGLCQAASKWHGLMLFLSWVSASQVYENSSPCECSVMPQDGCLQVQDGVGGIWMDSSAEKETQACI